MTNAEVVATRARWRAEHEERKAEQAASDRKLFTPRTLNQYSQWARRNDPDAFTEHAASNDVVIEERD